MPLSAILSSTREEIGLTNEGEGLETTKNTYLDVFVVFYHFFVIFGGQTWPFYLVRLAGLLVQSALFVHIEHRLLFLWKVQSEF